MEILQLHFYVLQFTDSHYFFTRPTDVLNEYWVWNTRRSVVGPFTVECCWCLPALPMAGCGSQFIQRSASVRRRGTFGRSVGWSPGHVSPESREFVI